MLSTCQEEIGIQEGYKKTISYIEKMHLIITGASFIIYYAE